MSKRFDNKKLLFLLTGLTLLLLLTLVIKIPKESATLKNRIIDADTSKVTKILLYPRNKKESPVEFNRKDGKWTVRQGDIVAAARRGAVRNILTEAAGIKPQSLATNNRDKWVDYELTDSLATRVKLLDARDKTLADLMIGKFSYKQVSDPYGGYGGFGGGNISGTSYVKLYDEKEVYAVDGFLVFTFSGSFNDWRDNTFIRSDRNNLTAIRFTYPADSSFSLTKEGTAWRVAGESADSAKVAEFLGSLALLDGQDFKDGYKPSSPPDFQVAAEGNNLAGFTVKCYKGENPDDYILNSSSNPEVYFLSKKDGIFGKVFKGRKELISGKK